MPSHRHIIERVTSSVRSLLQRRPRRRRQALVVDPPALESLEPRQLLTASVWKPGSVIEIRGDDNAESVLVRRSPNQSWKVQVYVDGRFRGVWHHRDVSKIRYFGNGGNDRFENQTNEASYVNGGGGNDTLIGGSGTDTIYGGSRKDHIVGGAGNDYLNGGSWNDRIYGGAGNDRLVDGHGNDRLYGESGNDNLEGGSGNDFLHGGHGHDVLKGGKGHDTLFGDGKYGSGNDKLYGNEGNDTLFGRWGRDELHGHAGHDKLYGGGHDDKLYGGSHRDLIYGGRGNDYLNGGSWNDRLFGGDGNDHLVDNHGDDRLYGEGGNDTLEAGIGNDVLRGGDGHDELHGHKGHDELHGGDGNDGLYGGSRRDVLYGGGGHDYLDGGSWSDRLFGDDGNDTLKGGTGNDRLRGGGGDDILEGGLGTDRQMGDSGRDQLLNEGEAVLTPTLLVTIHGATWGSRSGNFKNDRDGADWEKPVAEEMARLFREGGSETFVTRLEWSGNMTNNPAEEFGLDRIEEFLANQIQEWDVVLVGHSRGGILVGEIANRLDGVRNLRNVNAIMLDPTAAIPFGDHTLTEIKGHVGRDRAVVYDDGQDFSFGVIGLTSDSVAPAGARHIPTGTSGRNSHSHVAEAWYSESGYLQRDVDRILRSKDSADAYVDGVLRTDGDFKWDTVWYAPKPTQAEIFINGYLYIEDGQLYAGAGTPAGSVAVTAGSKGVGGSGGVTGLGVVHAHAGESGVSAGVKVGGVSVSGKIDGNPQLSVGTPGGGFSIG